MILESKRCHAVLILRLQAQLGFDTRKVVVSGPLSISATALSCNSDSKTLLVGREIAILGLSSPAQRLPPLYHESLVGWGNHLLANRLSSSVRSVSFRAR